MRLRLQLLILACTMAIALFLSGCYTEDPGPIRSFEKEINQRDFNGLIMGDAFRITVVQSENFEVKVSGDVRNVDDLRIENEDGYLTIRYENGRNRKHDTHIDIKMPTLRSIDFSGASQSHINGFNNLDELKVKLSGASVCEFDGNVATIDSKISGASYLYLYGQGHDIAAELSGASGLRAFHYPVAHADINASGASDGSITVQETLKVIASGASVVVYRGEPEVNADVSGASSVRRD